jgi:hypothetical protein
MNGDPLKYPNHIPYQQQFLSSQSGFNRPQSQRTNHQRYKLIYFFIVNSLFVFIFKEVLLMMMTIEMLKNKGVVV